MTEQEYNVLNEKTCAALSAQEMWDIEIYEPLWETLRSVESPCQEANEYYRKYAMSEKDYLQQVYSLILEAYQIVSERRTFWENKVGRLYEKAEEYEQQEKLAEAKEKYSEHELLLRDKLRDDALMEALGEKQDRDDYPEDKSWEDYTRTEILGL